MSKPYQITVTEHEWHELQYFNAGVMHSFVKLTTFIMAYTA